MAGAALGFVFNLLHPRASGTTVRDELELVSGSGFWVFDHYMLAWALGFLLVGLIAIGWSFDDEASASWGRFAAASAIVTTVVGYVTVAIDGMIFKEVADAWARAGGGTDSGAFATADAVLAVGLGLFTAFIGAIGFTALLFGVASWYSARHPAWVAYVALAAGVICLVASSIQYLGGISFLTANILFPIGSVLFTLWTFMAGLTLWRRADAPAAAASPTATTVGA